MGKRRSRQTKALLRLAQSLSSSFVQCRYATVRQRPAATYQLFRSHQLTRGQISRVGFALGASRPTGEHTY